MSPARMNAGISAVGGSACCCAMSAAAQLFSGQRFCRGVGASNDELAAFTFSSRLMGRLSSFRLEILFQQGIGIQQDEGILLSA